MKRVFIAEKPELARAIVEGLGGGTKKNGYYDCGDDCVTWCFGHMLQLKDPHDYDAKYQKWQMLDLPMSFVPWELKPGNDKEEQLNIIIDLLSKSKSCVHAGDADAEGQLLIDEILNYINYQKPVERVLINDNNLAPVRKALANMQPNSNFYGLSQAAEARSVGDQLYGFNMTRAYTLAARDKGYQGILSVGRVQTPVLGLVVRRDLEHESHKKSYFYGVKADFDIAGTQLKAQLKVNPDDPQDDKNRINDESYAKDLSKALIGQAAQINAASTKRKTEQPPLPYNLLKLQTDASRKFGLKPDKVKDITQQLREKYKLITYNRSDCQYLGDEHHSDASAVMGAISTTAPMLSRIANSANPSIKSRAFNSEKVTAHHAIIPTEATADFNKLTQDEQKIYILIARAYLAQFFPPFEYDQTDIEISCNNRLFTCVSKMPRVSGWKALYSNDKGNEEVETTNDAIEADLTQVSKGQVGSCTNSIAEAKETKPPARYTISTLLNDLTRVAKYIKDPELKALLIERDKDNAGEHGGIGTPATRDSIISNLFERGFLEEKGKSVISTQTARDFYNILPDIAKYPDMTAVWHQQQLDIEHNKSDCLSFISGLNNFIAEQVNEIKNNGLTGLKIDAHKCPTCKKPLRRIKGTKGHFWGCTGYQEGCKTSLPDKAGKPDFNQKKPTPSKLHKCMSCSSPLIRRKFKKSFFWGCSNYPKCEQSYPDLKGKPNFSKPKLTEVK
ncbi:DNA topoisomerase 3 [Pseudoalteromonas sp. SSM20]|uniref:DNA topoisomerase 3 n=1 Tax=Pseudoalteromonas sp. SSM20 TaxID=3139394 RepID=UPI003BA8A24A